MTMSMINTNYDYESCEYRMSVVRVRMLLLVLVT